jgi:hypothetical protein
MEKSRLDFIRIMSLAAAGFMVAPYRGGYPVNFQDKLPDLLVDQSGNSINSIGDWKEKRRLIIKNWSSYLGMLAQDPVPPMIRILKEEIVEDLTRQFIEYENEPGVFVKAYILKPQNIKKQLPGVVALHSTSDNQMLCIAGVEKGEIPPQGYNLAKLGFIVICPMCFLWRDRGDRNYEEQTKRFQLSHPGSKGMAAMLYDARRAVDVLENIKEVDRERIGTMGHSLGGKEALYLGAFDDRVKVIVSNEGGIGIDFSNWDDPWYLGNDIHNFNHAHHELLALCAPRPFLLIGGNFADGDRSIPYIDAVKPVYKLYGKPQNIDLFNHGQGHNVVPSAEKRTYEWITSHL